MKNINKLSIILICLFTVCCSSTRKGLFKIKIDNNEFLAEEYMLSNDGLKFRYNKEWTVVKNKSFEIQELSK